MGMFDTYGDIQLKVGPCKLLQYKIGDDVLIPDGVYHECNDVYEQAVVILGGKLIANLDVYDTIGYPR